MRLFPDFKIPFQSKKRILLMDDEAGFTGLVEMSLAKTDRYRIKVENDPTKVVEAALEFTPDLILLDLVMPKMDGRIVARLIRAEPRLKKTRIVFLTGSIWPKEDAAAGIDGYPALVKPIGIKELIQGIETNLA